MANACPHCGAPVNPVPPPLPPNIKPAPPPIPQSAAPPIPETKTPSAVSEGGGMGCCGGFAVFLMIVGVLLLLGSPFMCDSRSGRKSKKESPTFDNRRSLTDVEKNKLWWEIERSSGPIGDLIVERVIIDPNAIEPLSREVRASIAKKYGVTYTRAMQIFHEGETARWRTATPPTSE